MQPSEARRATPVTRKRGIRWARIILAAFLAEVAVILIIGAVIVVHRFWIAPGQTDAEYRAFGEVAGYYAGPVWSAVARFMHMSGPPNRQPQCMTDKGKGMVSNTITHVQGAAVSVNYRVGLFVRVPSVT